MTHLLITIQILHLEIMALRQLQESISSQNGSPLVNPSSQSGAPNLSGLGPAVWINHEPQVPLSGIPMNVNVSPGPMGFTWTCQANHCPHGLVTPPHDDLNVNITDDDLPKVNN
ncbi:hypothetical protein DSO57_1027708, partial [Entomophthora muscae]